MNNILIVYKYTNKKNLKLFFKYGLNYYNDYIIICNNIKLIPIRKNIKVIEEFDDINIYNNYLSILNNVDLDLYLNYIFINSNNFYNIVSMLNEYNLQDKNNNFINYLTNTDNNYYYYDDNFFILNNELLKYLINNNLFNNNLLNNNEYIKPYKLILDEHNIINDDNINIYNNINTNNILIYIIYHDDNSYNQCEWLKDISYIKYFKTKSTKYFESEIFFYLYDNKDEWINKNFVGFITYKVNINFYDIDMISIKYNDYDTIAFNNNTGGNMYNGTAPYHPELLNIYNKVFNLMNLNNEINYHIIPIFFNNYWMCKSSILHKYLYFFMTFINIINRNTELTNLINLNAYYDGNLKPKQLLKITGFPYYTYHCFILERLPCFYFTYYKYNLKLLYYNEEEYILNTNENFSNILFSDKYNDSDFNFNRYNNNYYVIPSKYDIINNENNNDNDYDKNNDINCYKYNYILIFIFIFIYLYYNKKNKIYLFFIILLILLLIIIFMNNNYVFEKLENNIILKQNLIIITIITDPNNTNYLYLINTAKINDVNINTIVTQYNLGHGYGFGIKLKIVHDYIEKLNDNDLIMVIDGYDILITSNEQDIINNYNKITNNNNKIVFSSEKGCWPDINLESQYPPSATSYKYLCAGAYIANIGLLKKLFIDNKYIFDLNIEELNRIDDQLFFTKIFLNNKNDIILDYNNNIFNSMYNGLNDLEFKNNKWYNNITNTYPIIFHANGPHESKDFLFNKIYPTII
jgi:hypothetical protein